MEPGVGGDSWQMMILPNPIGWINSYLGTPVGLALRFPAGDGPAIWISGLGKVVTPRVIDCGGPGVKQNSFSLSKAMKYESCWKMKIPMLLIVPQFEIACGIAWFPSSPILWVSPPLRICLGTGDGGVSR